MQNIAKCSVILIWGTPKPRGGFGDAIRRSLTAREAQARARYSARDGPQACSSEGNLSKKTHSRW